MNNYSNRKNCYRIKRVSGRTVVAYEVDACDSAVIFSIIYEYSADSCVFQLLSRRIYRGTTSSRTLFYMLLKRHKISYTATPS